MKLLETDRVGEDPVGERGEGGGTPLFCNLTKESFIDIERDGYSLKPRGYSLMHSNNLTLRKKYARTNVLKCYFFCVNMEYGHSL